MLSTTCGEARASISVQEYLLEGNLDTRTTPGGKFRGLGSSGSTCEMREQALRVVVEPDRFALDHSRIGAASVAEVTPPLAA